MKNTIIFIIQFYLSCIACAQKFDIAALKSNVISSTNDSIVSHDYAVLSYLYSDQKDSCLYFAKKAVSTAINSNDNVKAYAYNRYGNCMILFQKYDSAIYFFNLSNKLVDTTNVWLIGGNYHELSNIYKQLGQMDLAITCLFKSIQAKEATRDISQVIIIYLSASDFFEDVNEFNISLAYCKKAEYLNKILNNLSVAAKINEKYGAIALATSQYDSSLYYFNKALQMRVLTGEQGPQAYIHLCIAGIYLTYIETKYPGDYFQIARTELEKGLEISLACHSDVYIASAYNRLAGLFIQMNQLAKAKAYARLGLQYSIGAKVLSEERVSYQYLYECFDAEKNSDSALFYFRKHRTVSDSIDGDKIRQNLVNARVKYTYEKKVAIQQLENEREQAIKDVIIAKNKTRTQRLLFIGISIISILVIILLFIAYSHQQKKRRNQQKFSRQILQSQEEERLRISKDLHDGIGQNLLLLKSLEPEHAHLVQSTIDDLRTILKNLHPVQLEKIGFTATIRSMMEQVEKSVGIFVSGEVNNIDHVLSREVEINLYRIIQECLNNIIKHSGAADARIDIVLKEHIIFVTIQDNGKGFDWKKALHNSSFGITSIIERVNILKGTIHIQSAYGNTKINIEIPR